jgi:hypothetical protein
VPLSMCRWKSSADDARRRLMTSGQAESPSAPEAIEDQLRSGGRIKAIVIVRGYPPGSTTGDAVGRTYSSLWLTMLITLPSGARTKNLRTPHASSVSG